MSLHDSYVEYVKSLAPDAEAWVHEQIAEELVFRDLRIRKLRVDLEDAEAALRRALQRPTGVEGYYYDVPFG